MSSSHFIELIKYIKVDRSGILLQSETTPIPPLKQEMTVLWDSWLIIQH